MTLRAGTNNYHKNKTTKSSSNFFIPYVYILQRLQKRGTQLISQDKLGMAIDKQKNREGNSNCELSIEHIASCVQRDR